MKTATETAKHTPTPWSADRWAPGYTVSAPESHYSVCHLEGCNNEEANAQFIVRACNAHEELVGAVTLALDYLAPDHNNGHTRAWTEGMIEALRRALAKSTCNS